MKYRDGRTRWGPDDPYNDYFEEVLAAVLSINGVILDVGPGNGKLTDNAIGVDAYVESADVKAYMWDMPFEDESVDAVLTFHAMEHISKYQVLPTLNEFARVLKPDHPLIIVVPDLKWIMHDFLETTDIDLIINWKIDTVFGIQTHEGEYHRTGFTTEIIQKYFNEVPKLKIRQVLNVIGYNQWSLAILATKENGNGE